ncbi:ornithine cyclodeaminase family protein [Paenibacillus filicis]|uniref:Ornithine cyclodeaminase family protein n=1 Tax=Paenibacillus gyeongsangnamensis TaxID=3388067 RepID=A0ABT4Q3R3_9BACL|nr:ornithine cyclodeaminase family protein [Paenibacillus filicis]MCZ8511515.1 ornithine cyclodeaminase family protein [Paenibacillus filicis]
MADIICLSTDDIKNLLTFDMVMEAVKHAYTANSSKEGLTFPIVREKLSENAVFGVKSGYLPAKDTLGLKAAGFWTNNRIMNEEAHQATIVLIDPNTGKPTAFLDGNYITTIRTGAAGAVAADLFASKQARKLAVIGTGIQGMIQTEGLLFVRPGITEVRCLGHSGKSLPNYIDRFKDKVNLQVCSTVEETILDADIIVTSTPATSSFVFTEYVKPGCHINAMGADTKGKSELDKSVLQLAEIFVDDEHQSRTIGELQGLEDCQVTEIGNVLLGKHTGRQLETSVTVFDSTGIALQDITTATLAIQMAKEQGVGTVLHW